MTDHRKQGKNNRLRGVNFERENVRYFRDKGWELQRRDQSRGGEYNPDILFFEKPENYPMNYHHHECHHHECKRVSKWAPYKWWDKALSDAKGREPVILIRADNRETLCLISRKRYEEMCRLLNIHEVF
jgi:hypothetical protein